MIKINGHTISNIVTSTVMGHYGDGMFPLTLLPAYRELMRVVKQNQVTNFTKSSTYKKRAGNFQLYNPLTWKYIQRVGSNSNGLLNAYGLTNQGAEINAKKISSTIAENGLRVIPNFYPQFAVGRDQANAETIRAIEIYAYTLCSWFWALELNLSCPNDKTKIRENMADALACVKAIRQVRPNLCLIAKISIVHPYEFAQKLIDAGVDIIHAINTIPYDLVYPKGPPSPLRAVGGGGVSGGPAFRQALAYNAGLRRLITAPIIMGCGVIGAWDANAYFGIGADAVSICSVCRLNPGEAIRIIKECAR